LNFRYNFLSSLKVQEVQYVWQTLLELIVATLLVNISIPPVTFQEHGIGLGDYLALSGTGRRLQGAFG
jgi:hypothetical protein